MDLFLAAYNRDQFFAVVNAVMEFGFYKMRGNA
jgi:hypothetical protein